ncbi:MAG TPA: hypothetical protein ENJ05_04945 [Thiotrichales bacterium]|nr:hypothetical protein [Thiotrichales bacterium]
MKDASDNPTVDLHIEELVLEGFPHLDRNQLGTAIREALAHLIATQGIPASMAREGSIATLEGGTFTVPPGSNPQAIGEQIARAIYGSSQR